MQVIHWEWPCHSRDTEQRKMFSYRRGKKRMVIKSKRRLYHATILLVTREGKGLLGLTSEVSR